VGSLSGAGIVGLLGAGVSSLTHCGLGSFGARRVRHLGDDAPVQRLEPVLIPAGYALLALAILARAKRLARAWPGAAA
jgi:hypothetical protein